MVGLAPTRQITTLTESWIHIWLNLHRLKSLLAMIANEGEHSIFTDTVHHAILFIEAATMHRTTQLIL